MRPHRLLPFVLVAACSRRPPDLPPVDAKVYQDSMAAFYKKRMNGIAGPDGWATLIGLWWLKPGASRIGSDSTLEIVLPTNRSPKLLGTVALGDSARFTAAPGIRVRTDSQPVTATITLHDDVEGDGKQQTNLHYGSLIVSYITRNGRQAIRVKDTLAEARVHFAGFARFPIDTAWRLTALFTPRPKPDSMNIVDVLGIETRMSWPGELRFRIGGREYALQVIREPEDHGKRMFVMFRDSTNGKETYPAMRYVYVNQPDSLGRTPLDFNQSYNPPCAYTSSSTCPLPPKGNSLPFRVTAGELKPAGH